LGLLLRCPELDIRLVLSDFGKPNYRARLFAKFLQTVGRSNIPVGLGVECDAPKTNPQEEWIKDYDLKKYPGKIHQDGVQALIDLVMQSKQPMTILAIGPVTNLAAALEREPRIASRARIVGMHGSVRRGYGNKETPDPEYNVVRDIKACQKVFTASWSLCITPLDTCGLIDLHSERYQKLLASKDPIATTIIENYRIWETFQTKDPNKGNHRKQSTTLFDTVAVYLAATQAGKREFVTMEQLGIRVDEKGFTVIDPAAKKIEVATAWKDLDGFRDYLVERLTQSQT